jgi:hypothetical protein
MFRTVRTNRTPVTCCQPIASAQLRGLGFLAIWVLSFLCKLNTFVLRVLVSKPAFFVLDKISFREIFHVSFAFIPTRNHAEVSLG